MVAMVFVSDVYFLKRLGFLYKQTTPTYDYLPETT